MRCLAHGRTRMMMSPPLQTGDGGRSGMACPAPPVKSSLASLSVSPPLKLLYLRVYTVLHYTCEGGCVATATISAAPDQPQVIFHRYTI